MNHLSPAIRSQRPERIGTGRITAGKTIKSCGKDNKKTAEKTAGKNGKKPEGSRIKPEKNGKKAGKNTGKTETLL